MRRKSENLYLQWMFQNEIIVMHFDKPDVSLKYNSRQNQRLLILALDYLINQISAVFLIDLGILSNGKDRNI